MLTSPALMRLERYFLSAFPQLFALTFGMGAIGGGGGGGLGFVWCGFGWWFWFLGVVCQCIL